MIALPDHLVDVQLLTLRVFVVHVKLHPQMGFPVQHVQGKGFALQQVNHREVPAKHIVINAALPGNKIKKLTRLAWRVIIIHVTNQLQPAMDVQPQDEHCMPGRKDCLANRAKIGLAVHCKCNPTRVFHAPAVTAWLYDRITPGLVHAPTLT